MADTGDLLVSGPIEKNENLYRGIFILNVKTVNEANKFLQTDPSINSNLLEVELYP
ncbi:MAG TPA: hypothetical protein VKA26_13125 [Ignavibacteriaceae bacterium]|nr:hypothetical protein [Ignavibacteriaceae bacterium]